MLLLGVQCMMSYFSKTILEKPRKEMQMGLSPGTKPSVLHTLCCWLVVSVLNWLSSVFFFLFPPSCCFHTSNDVISPRLEHWNAQPVCQIRFESKGTLINNTKRWKHPLCWHCTFNTWGRDFTYTVLSEQAGQTDTDLGNLLDSLVSTSSLKMYYYNIFHFSFISFILQST